MEKNTETKRQNMLEREHPVKEDIERCGRLITEKIEEEKKLKIILTQVL